MQPAGARAGRQLRPKPQNVTKVAKPAGAMSAEQLAAQAGALFTGGETESARAKYVEALAQLASPRAANEEALPAPTGTDEPATTWVQIPEEQEMMRQMLVMAAQLQYSEQIARCDVRLGRWAVAIVSATELIARNPRSVDALLIRAQAQASSGALLQGQTDAQRAVKVAPADRSAECEKLLADIQRALRGPAARHLWRATKGKGKGKGGKGGLGPAPPPTELAR